jgi:glycosyltransferase involved in cell wall biosynthesis
VASGAAIAFRQDNLAEVLESALRMPEAEIDALREKAAERVRTRYSWDAVTDVYEKLLTGLGNA